MMLTNKTWNVSEYGCQGHSDTLFDVLLKNRGITDPKDVEDFVTDNPTLWHDPFLYNDMARAVEIITESIARGEKILVYGDYDCDGVTATAIIVRYLKSHGCNVDYIVPHRAEHGYGLTDNIIDSVYERNPNLLITVDCGITNIETVSEIRKKGIKVIVTDHHNVKGDEIPDADCVICAKRSDNTYPFIDLCGAGVALKLVEAMGRKSPYKVTRSIWRQAVEMAGIATIADLVSVVNENRTIIKKALESMNSGEPANPGVRMMNRMLADEGKPVDETYISFNFVPRVNAAGRLYDSSEALKLFLEDDEEKAAAAASELTRENDERKAIESTVFEAAVKQIENPDRPEEWSLTNTVGPLVVYGNNWHQGVLGIVAGKLAQYFRRSAIVFTNDSIETDCIKGSGRAYGDFDLFSVLTDVSDTIVNFGGHKKAAGIVVKKSEVGTFMRCLEARSREIMAEAEEGTQDDVLDIECELMHEEVTFETYKNVCRLKPFGIANPKPVFVTRGLIISDIYAMSDGAHLRVDLVSAENNGAPNGGVLSAMGFGMGDYIGCFAVGDKVDIAYTLNEYKLRGNITLSLHLEDIRPNIEEFAWEKQDTLESLYNSGLQVDQIVKINKGGELRDLVPDTSDYGHVYSTIKELCGGKNTTADCSLLAKMINNKCKVRVTPFVVKRCLEVFSEAGLIKLGRYGTGRVCFTILNVQGKPLLGDTATYKRLNRV
ncbi:single-stranded-DNA-specific exonuclease RecJ [Ruminococcaceae bacterium YRB3002]|nr:single-stranded-DNA-specific exonuclease RecJ [Ruminococcaceae bacterium YRB3002]